MLAPIGFLLPMSVGAVLMSASTIVVALNAQLLRRLDLSPDTAAPLTETDALRARNADRTEVHA